MEEPRIRAYMEVKDQNEVVAMNQKHLSDLLSRVFMVCIKATVVSDPHAARSTRNAQLLEEAKAEVAAAFEQYIKEVAEIES